MKMLIYKNKTMIKWIGFALIFVSSIIILLSKNSAIEGHVVGASVLYSILSFLFFLPLLDSITLNKNGKASLEFKFTFLLRGIICILLILSSYMLFLYKDDKVTLWFWACLTSLIILLIIELIVLLIKTNRDYKEKSFWHKAKEYLNKIAVHFNLIFMLILLLINLFDSPRELYLENIKTPNELAVIKRHNNEEIYRSIMNRVDIKSQDIVQTIYDEIRSNKEVSNIRGPEFIHLLRAEINSDYYYLVSPMYDDSLVNSSLKTKMFDSIRVHPDGYVIVAESKASFNIFRSSTWKYKIELSHQSVEIIDDLFSDTNQGL